MRVPKYPPNNPMEKYSYGFKMEHGCSCNPPCGDWLLYHYHIDMDGNDWVDMGTYMNSKEAILEKIVSEHLPTEYTPYTPRQAQAVMELK